MLDLGVCYQPWQKPFLDLEFAISHGKNFHVGLGLLSAIGKTLLFYLETEFSFMLDLEFAISHGENFNVGLGVCLASVKVTPFKLCVTITFTERYPFMLILMA